MNTVDEAAVRAQLVQALEVLDPVAPPLAQLTAPAVRRRRRFRIAGGIGAVGLATAGVVVAAVVISAGPSGTSRVMTGNAPTAQSLIAFAKANGAVKSYTKSTVISPPLAGRDGYYGGFAVKKGLALTKWTGSAWRLDGHVRSKFGPGLFILKIKAGPATNGPSMYVRGAGGDVAYFGYVLEHQTTGWHPVHFGRYDSVSYGRPGGPGFISVSNDCRPNCAEGTQSRDYWKWRPAKDKFVLVRSQRLS